MRRTCCLGLLGATFAVSLLLGCVKTPAPDTAEQPVKVADNPGPAPVNPGPKAGGGGDQPAPKKDGDPQPAGPVGAGGDSDQAKYEAALLDAFDLLGQKKYPEALTSFEAAAKFKDSEFLQTEIKKLRLRIDQQNAAEQTLQDIQTVLDQGKAAEASKLAAAALKEFGDSDFAPAFAKIKLQADALASADAPMDDKAARAKTLKTQGLLALGDGNLRAALLSFDQSLNLADDDGLRKTADEVRARLTKYDDNRAKAAELRKDPGNLEDAIDLLKEAAKQWDTQEVRDQIDDYNVALQNRRDRISVADFEVRGEVGIPAAERALAEELLPNFKTRYDLVERAQVVKVLGELKLESGKLNDVDGQAEVGKLARVRYLVLGSVTRLGGLVVNARLVDVRSGLIVQTAKVSGGSPEELLAQMPLLAKLLMMSDDERLAYEQEQIKTGPVAPAVSTDQPLPPPPEVQPPDQPPPPPMVTDAGNPGFGTIKIQQFQQFVAPPAQPQVLVYGGDAEEAWKKKALVTSLVLGDNLFRRGKYHEALRHYEFGLTLAPGQLDLTIRVNRCRPLLPPPPVVIVAPPPKPRIAVVDFVVVGDLPPGLSVWVPQRLAPYFYNDFDVVDRGELFWWMGRLGMTVQDLMQDPYARRWLGRALNVRYFVLGNVVQTNSFDVNTYLIDAEYGYLNGRGFVHSHDIHELKHRLGELARGTLTPPALFQQQQQEFQSYEGLILKAQVASKKGDFTIAIGFLEDARKVRPKSIEITVLLNQYQGNVRRRELEEGRRKEFERQQKLALEQKLRQEELCREAERQRILAAKQFADFDAEQRRLAEQKRLADQLAAHQKLVVQADVAFNGGNFKLSVQVYESALQLRQDDGVYKKLARAKLELERVTAKRVEEENKLKQVQIELAQQEELKKTRLKLEAERKQRELAELSRREVQRKLDEAEYARLLGQGEKELAAGKTALAIANFQGARQHKKTDQVEQLIQQATLKQVADGQGEAARLQLEQQLKAEQEARLKAEAGAKLNQDKYLLALKAAQKAQADRQFDTAIAKYNEAGKMYQTDVVLTGLKQATEARDKALADAAAAKQKLVEEQTKQANFKKLMTEGETAFVAKDYAGAVAKFKAANTLIPGNVDAMAGLTKAEHARDVSAGETLKKSQDEDRVKHFNSLLKAGQDNFAGKHFDAAVVNLTEALKLRPNDPTATKLLQQAEKARNDTIKTADQADAAKKTAAAYQKAMNDGRLAMQAKRFDDAIKSFKAAQDLLPGDKASSQFMLDAQKQKDDLRAAEVAAAKKKADDLQRQHDVDKALTDGRTALAANNLDLAAKSFGAAAKLAPDNPAVKLALQDLQKAQLAAQAQADAAAKRKQQYDALLTAGKKAFDEKRYDDAVKLLGDANALLPNDPGAKGLLKLAHDGQQAAKAAADTAKRKADFDLAVKQGKDLLGAKKYDEAIAKFKAASTLMPGDPTVPALIQQAEKARNDASAGAQKQAEFDKLMKAGNDAFVAKKFSDAVKLYGDASKLMPTDQQAAKSLKAAQDAWDASKGPTPQQLAEYTKQMSNGAALDKQKKWEDAMKSYQAALKEIPKDAKAQTALNKSTYHYHMAEGDKAYAAKQYPTAIREYEAALRLYPDDMDAKTALKKAKDAK